MKKKDYHVLFFDLDGTLTDPGVGITNSVMHALKYFGIEETDRTKLYKFIGPPLPVSFRDFYGFSEEDCEKAVMYYREYFAQTGIFENKVYPDIPEVLTKLRKAGHELYVATSKPTEYSVRILERFNLLSYFTFVSGADMNEKNSTKAAIIEHALQISQADPKDVLMIGDRFHDIVGAKTNNIDCAGVLYGYGSLEEMKEYGADYIVETVSDLLQFL